MTEPLIGEHPALDLANTRTAGTDLLTTLDELRAWLSLEGERVGGIDAGEAAGLSGDDLVLILNVREHTSAVLHALLRRRRPPQDALDGLADAQRAAPGVRELVWDGSALTARWRRSGPPGGRLAAWLADAAAELASSPEAARLRQCEAEDCVLLFVPAHPRRRWCSPARCGNRVRVARHYHRHKET